MDYPRARLVRALAAYFGPDDRRIEHALRVLHHADRVSGGRTDRDPDIDHSPSRYDYPELAVLKEPDRIVNRDEKI